MWHSILVVKGLEKSIFSFNSARMCLVRIYGSFSNTVSIYDDFVINHGIVRRIVMETSEIWGFLCDPSKTWPIEFLDRNESYYRKNFLNLEFRTAWHSLISSTEEVERLVKDSDYYTNTSNELVQMEFLKSVCPLTGISIARVH